MTADAAPQMDFWRILDLIGQQFPQFLPILTEPGIFDVFSQAIQDPASWSPERVQSAIQQTPWYKTNSNSARAWYLLQISNPAEAKQQEANARIAVNQQIEQLGLSLSPYDTAILALHAAENGWNSDRIKMEAVAINKGAAALGPGGIGDTMTQFNKAANDQGVNIHTNDLYWWAANSAAGNVTPQAYADYLKQQATNLYPALTPALAQGQTVAQFAQPYFATAAQELGINPNQITLQNPKWIESFLGSNDKGQQTVLSMNESLQKIRTDPAFGYDSGTPGITAAAQFATTLRQQMGMQG